MPDDVATPERMTPDALFFARLGAADQVALAAATGIPWKPMVGLARRWALRMAELRTVEAQLAEARRALEAARDFIGHEPNCRCGRGSGATDAVCDARYRAATSILAKLDADRSG